MEFLLYSLAISFGVNILVFFLAFITQKDTFTDITYSIVFALIYTLNLFVFRDIKQYSFFDIAAYVVVMLWAIRLGAFLLYRVHVFKKDARFDKMRKSFIKFGTFWLIQGATNWIVSLPLMFAGSFYITSGNNLSIVAFILLGVAFISLVLETIADMQKLIFKLQKKPGFIKSGLWSISRHPNYFFEIAFWFLFSISIIFYGTNKDFVNYEGIFSLVGPLFLMLLINFLSGVPILERNSLIRYKGNKEYEDYLKKTSNVIPFIGKRKVSQRIINQAKKKKPA
jgi:steroid 5-alpha reductase family enzyme